MIAEQETKTKFVVLLSGQIETAEFFTSDNFYFKYSYVYGSEWRQITGLEEGLSARCQRNQGQSSLVIGLPIEATFTSGNPFGWPQLVLSCYGTDGFGNDIVKGYGATHIPTVPGRSTRQIAMFVPEASSAIQKFIGWILGKRPEFTDPNTVAYSQGRQVTRVRSQGFVTVTMTIMVKDIKKLGYDTVPSTMSQISEYPLPIFEKERQKPFVDQKRRTDEAVASTSGTVTIEHLERRKLPLPPKTEENPEQNPEVPGTDREVLSLAGPADTTSPR